MKTLSQVNATMQVLRLPCKDIELF